MTGSIEVKFKVTVTFTILHIYSSIINYLVMPWFSLSSFTAEGATRSLH